MNHKPDLGQEGAIDKSISWHKLAKNEKKECHHCGKPATLEVVHCNFSLPCCSEEECKKILEDLIPLVVD